MSTVLTSAMRWHCSWCENPTGAVQASQNGSLAQGAPPQAPVIVWFKADLRTDDHPGLQKALASGRPVIGFFSFDSEVLADQSTMLWGPQGESPPRLQSLADFQRLPISKPAACVIGDSHRDSHGDGCHGNGQQDDWSAAG